MNDMEKAQIKKWNDDCQHIEDLVNNCPSLMDADMLHDWYNDVHGRLIYLGNAAALSQSMYATQCAIDVAANTISDHVWQRIGKSSTLISEHLMGRNSDMFYIWQRIKNLNRNLETILSDMRTLLVGIREADRRDNMSSQNQRQGPQPSQASNPAVRNEYEWPKEQSVK